MTKFKFSPVIPKDRGSCGICAISSPNISHENIEKVINANKKQVHRSGQSGKGGDGVGIVFEYEQDFVWQIANEIGINQSNTKADEIYLGTIYFIDY